MTISRPPAGATRRSRFPRPGGVRLLALLVGISWGAGLGFLAGLATTAAVAGFAWLYLFGDGAWPPAFPWLLGMVGGLAGVGTLLLALTLAWRVADRLEARMPLPVPRLRRLRRQALALAAVPPLVAAGVLAMQAGGDHRRQDAEQALAAFAERAPRITAVTFLGWHTGQGRVRITFAGRGSGAARLEWTVADSVYGRILGAGERPLVLSADTTAVEFTLEKAALVAAYRQHVLSGPGAVRVEDAARLAVTVLPTLSAAERDRLPARITESPPTFRQRFMSRAATTIPLLFTVTGGSVY